MRQFRTKAGTADRGAIALVAAAITVIILAVATADAAMPLVTEMSISDAIEDEMLLDRAVPSQMIDVATIDGIVTLTGTVDNLLAKERAARISRSVKGVRSVVNKITVTPPVLRTDREIREDVEEALLFDPAADAYEVNVSVANNTVTLTGTVDSWQEKQLCGKVAKGVKGVMAVENELQVAWSRNRTDPEIMAEVEKTLRWNTLVDHALIDVSVMDGKVELSGVVGSAAEKNEAFMDAHVAGVKSVDASGLEVKKWARDKDLRGDKYAKRSAAEIENALMDAMLYDPRVSSFKITPQVVADGTEVILRGTVDNLKAKRAAEQDARNTVGVWNVDNRIKVRPEVRPSDRKIEEDARRALLRDPYVEKYEINVTVRNGVANLYGTVDSYFEKAQADDIVSRIEGVVLVDNHLKVDKTDSPYVYDPYVDEWYLSDRDWYAYKPFYSDKSDLQIQKDIEDQLFWSPFVDASQITVTVNNGEATLTGTVDSYTEYGAAQDNAYEGGAVFVDNNLTVK